jgi:hypothetical protein
MGRLPALPILYWGLPVLAFGLGAILLMTLGLQLACRCGPLDVPALLIAVYFTSSGLVALVARWRDATNLADSALFAIGFGVLIGALGVETQKLLAFQRPLATLSGQLTRVDVMRHRGGGVDATLTLSGGRRVTWNCAWTDCHGRDDALLSLRRDLPQAARMQVAGNQLIGLTADSVQILDPERDRPRQFGVRVLSVGFCGLALAGLTLFGYFRWRKTKATYVTPAATVLPKLRRPRP